MNTVKTGESPQRVITSGSKTYLLFPDYGVTDLATAGWAIKRIDETSATDVTIMWAEGSLDKKFAANNLAALTFSNIL